VTAVPLLLCDIDDKGVATLTVNRPEAHNALDADVLEAIHSTVQSLVGKAKAILLTGAGKSFVAGADIAQMAAFSRDEAREFSLAGQDSFQALADFPGPVVAAINGYALGGGLELAMACDILVASDKAVVGQPEVQLGVVPGFGGSQRLSRRTGPGIAKWLLMSGEKVKADEALRLGIFDKVVPHEQLIPECRKILEACLQNGPLAVARVKRLVDDGLDLVLPEALELEAEAFGDAFATHDQKEGMRAFLEKRRAQFKGH
jgi:enoyl-CoA hydratase